MDLLEDDIDKKNQQYNILEEEKNKINEKLKNLLELKEMAK